MHLGITVVLEKSMARIHKDNLINFGIVPLLPQNPEDYDRIQQEHRLKLTDINRLIEEGAEKAYIENLSTEQQRHAGHDRAEISKDNIESFKGVLYNKLYSNICYI